MYKKAQTSSHTRPTARQPDIINENRKGKDRGNPSQMSDGRQVGLTVIKVDSQGNELYHPCNDFSYTSLTTTGHWWSTSRVSTSPTVTDGQGKTIHFMVVRGGFEFMICVSRQTRLFNRV